MKFVSRRIKSGVAGVAAITLLAACGSSGSAATAVSSSGAATSATSGTSAAGAATSAASGASGASGATSAATNAPAVSLQFLTFTSPNVTKSLWETASANVTKKFPNVTLKLEYTPTLDRQGYAKQLLATGQLPDILWDAPAPEFVKAGALLNFDPSDLKGMNVPSGYGTIGGKTYNLWNGSFIVPAMQYNKAAFAKAGVSVPTTFDGLVAAAAKLKAAGITPFLVQSGSDLWSDGFLLQGIVTAEVYGKTPDWGVQRKAGKVKFSDPDFVAAVNKFVALRDAGYFNKDALSINYAQSTAQWDAGKAAMWPMGSWATAAKTVGFDQGVFVIPSSNGTKVLPDSIGAAVYVSAKTAHPAEAKKAAISLVTDPAWQAADMKNDAVLPIIDGITPLPGTAKATIDSLALVNDKSYTHVVGFLSEVGDDAAPAGFSDAFGKAMQALIGGESAADFAASLDKSWDTLAKS